MDDVAKLSDGEALRTLVGLWMRGNKAAVDLIYDIADIAHLYDDLIDRDKEVEEWRIHNAFLASLVRMPRNPVFAQCSGELATLLEAAILNWRASNALASNDPTPERMHIADVIRYSFAEVVIYIARLVGGHEHAAAIAPEVWANIRNDTFAEFLQERHYEAHPR
jgi:hypothetical protein